MRSNMAWLTLAVGSLFWSPCLRADGVDLKGEGAFGFPQARAQVLCDRENLRVSAWSNSEYLYVQAIVWADDDEHGGEINGREYHDYSTIDFDLDGDKARTRLVDRTYSLNIPGSPGLHGSVVMTERGGAAGREHSAGRGLIKYVQNVDGKKVRVDSFLIPLAEIEKKTGDTVRFSYWTRSPKPEFVANSVGFESDKLYFWHGLPVDKFHEYKLLDSGAFDQNALPAEPETPAETTVTRPAVAAAPTLTIGSRAPALAIEHWVQDGQGQFKPITEFDPGKVYIVEFWATWCGPCIAAMPHIADLQKTYADQGLQVISISDETLDVVEKFLERKVPAQKDKEGKEPKEITYRELTNAYCLTTDPDRSNHDNYMKAAGQNGIPRAFIVGKDGHIEWIGHPMSIDKALASVIEGNWDRALYAAEFKEGEEFSRKLRDIMSLAYAGKFDSARKELSEAGDAASSATIKERVPTLLRTISRIEVEKLILQNSDEAVAKLEAFLEGQLPEEVNNVVWNFIVEATEKGRNVRPEILACALRLTDKAVQATPEDSYLLDTHAHVLQLNGKIEQAIEFQEKAVKLTDERSRQDVVNYLEKLRGLKDPQYVPKPHVKKVSELRRLEGHTNKATYVTFSPAHPMVRLYCPAVMTRPCDFGM